MIRDATIVDAAPIADIYNYYVLNDTATFEEQEVSGSDMAERIRQVQGDGLPWILAEKNQDIVGYAYASRWKSRSAYRHSVEITVYVSVQHAAQGQGGELYRVLFKKLRQLPIHAVIGGITLPNPASIALHEKFGMQKVAHFKEVGFKFDRWLDVGYWQCNLDRDPIRTSD